MYVDKYDPFKYSPLNFNFNLILFILINMVRETLFMVYKNGRFIYTVKNNYIKL